MYKQVQHILMAEDDEDDINLFKEALEGCGNNVLLTVVNNGRQLLETLELNASFDFIVLDLNLPYCNGHECLKHIRQRKKFGAIPVMVYSTSSMRREIESCIADGADYYNTKPNTFDEIVQLVCNICCGNLNAGSM